MYNEVRMLRSKAHGSVHIVTDEEGRKYIRRTLPDRGSTRRVYTLLMENPHTDLPKISAISENNGSLEIIEEYIDGTTLNLVPVSEKKLKKCTNELCSVLMHIHSLGIIHRDIKPANIMLSSDGHIKLIDFEAARLLSEDADKDTVYLGTEGYAPPEQYGYKQTDIRSDIFALGKTLEQLMGSMAYQKKYRAVIDKCTEFDPQKRYSNAKEVMQELTPVKLLPITAALLTAAVFAVFVAVNRNSTDMLSSEAADTAAESGVSYADDTDKANPKSRVLYNKDALDKYSSKLMNIDIYDAELLDEMEDPLLFQCDSDIEMDYIIIDGRSLRNNKYVMMALDMDGDGEDEIYQISSYLPVQDNLTDMDRKLTIGKVYTENGAEIRTDITEDVFFEQVFNEITVTKQIEYEDYSRDYDILRDDYYVQLSILDTDNCGKKECAISIGYPQMYYNAQDDELWSNDSKIYTGIYSLSNKELRITDNEDEFICLYSGDALYADSSAQIKTYMPYGEKIGMDTISDGGYVKGLIIMDRPYRYSAYYPPEEKSYLEIYDENKESSLREIHEQIAAKPE